MIRKSFLSATVALVVLACPSPASGHGGAEPIIHVIAERVIQGETFTVLASDLGPSALVTFEILASGQTYPIGQVIAQPDGHFTETFVMPSATPDGYAELWARSDDGSQAMMWLLVGDGPDTGAPGPPSGSRASGDWPLPVIALVAAWVVGLASIGYVFMRSRKSAVRVRHRRT